MSTPYYSDDAVTVHAGDCLDVLASLPDASVDAVVTDPPYGLEFMGKDWDAPWKASSVGRGSRVAAERAAELTPRGKGHSTSGGAYLAAGVDSVRVAGKPFQEWCDAWSRECLRVLKPGGHMLAFGGSRTWHRLAAAVEDAGFEIRDSIAWLYGSGFPKSLDVSKAIDKAAGAVREVVGVDQRYVGMSERAKRAQGATTHEYSAGWVGDPSQITAPATPAAEQWQGWGTALKPAHEPVVVARKPPELSDLLAKIGSHLDRLEKSWQAQAAERATRTGAGEDSSAETVMSWSESAVAMFSNTVTSWRRNWADLCELTSTSTTSITSATTTALRTCESFISRLTVTNTLRVGTSPLGLTANASAVDALFASAVYESLATRARSAAESAIDSTQRERPDGADRGSSPAFEPIVVGRKPLAGTVAVNLHKHGTGALNIDACRTGAPEDKRAAGTRRYRSHGFEPGVTDGDVQDAPHDGLGRWPTNVVLDDVQAAELDAQTGILTSGTMRAGITPKGERSTYGQDAASGYVRDWDTYGDSGGASRFFPTFHYEAKAPSAERPRVDGIAHPTVKPLDLMRWLVRLVTPRGGVVLDPFLGSGTTAEACVLEGFRCIGIEREPTYLPLIVARLSKPLAVGLDFGEVSA